ncbi:MAG: YcfA-like protein [Candidatus Scalindua rubra]|uniref:YcfA-like protein n=1 Tax=Candidatus Scalindua rubra TaxID=1872076 RepID=A0A1E3X6G2_9BACT|nr:MAG: YcfA-like protein [Candidatus Scalindua rubra]
MSKKLKLCSGKEVVRKFQRAGWSAVRQKGSHVTCNNDITRISVDFIHSPAKRNWAWSSSEIDPPGRPYNKRI